MEGGQRGFFMYDKRLKRLSGGKHPRPLAPTFAAKGWDSPAMFTLSFTPGGGCLLLDLAA